MSRNRRSGPAKPPTLDEIRVWPATVDVGVAAVAFGISRRHAYELVKAKQFPARTIQMGERLRVVTASIVRALSEEAA